MAQNFINNKAHGTYRVNIQDNVMYAFGHGPFNKELIIDYQKAVMQAAQELSENAWGSMVVLDGLGLMTPDAEELLVQAVKKRMDMGMIAATTVFINAPALELQTMQMTKVYDQAGVHYALFDNETAGKEWIKQQLENQYSSID